MGVDLDPGALWLACSQSPAFFLDRCGYLYDPVCPDGGVASGWQPFRLWPSPGAGRRDTGANRLCVILKARQLGISWLTVGFGLWLMLFRPAATVLLFSKRDDEAVHLLSFRLRGMYDRLPRSLQAERRSCRDNAHEFRLSNGSAALAFPTTGGRSYTASLAIVDEADFADDLDSADQRGEADDRRQGRLIMLSTVDKSLPSRRSSASIGPPCKRRERVHAGLPALERAAGADGSVVRRAGGRRAGAHRRPGRPVPGVPLDGRRGAGPGRSTRSSGRSSSPRATGRVWQATRGGCRARPASGGDPRAASSPERLRDRRATRPRATPSPTRAQPSCST